MRVSPGFLAVLTFAAFCLDAGAAVTLVAHKVSKDITGAELTALSSGGYSSSPGNLIAVWAVSYGGAQPVGLVTDSAGDTFTPATPRNGTWHGQWFYAKNVKGDSFNVVTVHPAATGRATFTYPGIIVLEYSGVDKASPLDIDTAGAQGSMAAWTSASFNAAGGEVVLVGIVTATGSAYTAGPGYTVEDSYITPGNATFSFAAEDQVFSAAQTGITAGIAWAGAHQATGAVISLKPAAAP